MKKLIIAVFFACMYNVSGAKNTDTLHVYFDIGVSALSPAAQRSIDSLLYNEVFVPGKKIGIVGYADYLGNEESNVGLSERRAKSVQAYLESMGIKQDDIQLVTGKGAVDRAIKNGNTGYPEDRKVDIIKGGLKPTIAKSTAQVFDISKIKKNEVLRLNNIYFQPGSHMVRDESLPVIDTLYRTLRDNPNLHIRIEGHICCLLFNTDDGYDTDSQDFHLSENRAQYIYDDLISRKIAASRLEYKGFGIKKPLRWPEKTPEDENMNRRVEIRILSK